MSLASTQDTALEPVRSVMLRRARERAARIVGEATGAARALTEQARIDAAAAVAQAKDEGAAEAEPVAAAELNRSRRAARTAMLGAELTTRDDLAGRIRAAVLGLREDPGYPELLGRLTELAGRAAGVGAVISEHPAGGVIARAEGILVDCSLPRLADRAVAALSARIAGLCGQ